jgi:glycine/D-amino acid oxidase-like deaminating enzyme
VKDIDGYYEAVTHGGITLCVILGRLLADEIVGGGTDPLIRLFRPDRFVSERVSIEGSQMSGATGGTDR